MRTKVTLFALVSQHDGIPLPRNSTEMQSYNAEVSDHATSFPEKNTFL